MVNAARCLPGFNGPAVGIVTRSVAPASGLAGNSSTRRQPGNVPGGRDVGKRAMNYTSCHYCGKAIPAVNPLTAQARKFCSRKCKDLNWQKQHGWCKSLKEHKERKGSKQGHLGRRLECPVCGEEFVARSPNQKYCGKACARIQEYFVSRYGDKWRLAKNRFKFATELAAFKREVKDGE
jgi:endogenous inhibitor of DNA gyrase (YacG/DUF329 family)